MGNDLSDTESGLIHSKGKASETRCDLNNVLSFSHTPHPQIIFKTFIMVFFAEWGDRSQFSTIALAGTHPISSGTAPFRSFSNAVVILGAAAGYIVATLCGVLGGDYFARVLSPRVISISGGILFILFAVQILIMKDSLVCFTNALYQRHLHLRRHSLRRSNPHHENLSCLFHKHSIHASSPSPVAFSSPFKSSSRKSLSFVPQTRHQHTKQT